MSNSMAVDVFLGHCQGFHSRIKAVPEHFVVEEISCFTGENDLKNPVDDEAENLKRKPDGTIPISSKRLCTEVQQECSEAQLSKDEKESQSDLVPSQEKLQIDVQICKTKLHTVLSPQSYSELQAFANKAKETYRSQQPLNEKEKPLTLGNFSTRDERTLLHRCARFVFPQLKTVTTPNTSDVSAHICRNYFKFSDVIGDSKTDELLRFILVESAENLRDDITIAGDFSKETRLQIHHLIASCYGKFIEARTSPDTEDGLSRITIRPKRKPTMREKDAFNTILAFTLWKRNTETHTAIQRLASHLRLQSHMLNFAGLKDKRAVTMQRCTVCGISQSRLERLCQSLPKHFRVSNISPVSRVIRLGELNGNRFSIRLTEVFPLEEVGHQEKTCLRTLVESSLRTVEKSGFVNYFGPQRFGRRVLSEINSSVVGLAPDLEGPAIGLAMLKGDFKRAVKILLDPAENTPSNENNDVEKAKMHFQATGDIEATLKIMPQHKLREIAVLQALRRFGTADSSAFTKALLGMPHNARLFYVHSFCSWAWNKVATARLRLYGLKPVPGDLAVVREESETETVAGQPSVQKVFVVTEGDIVSGRVGLEDIVLAVPGNQIRYPPNMEQEYKTILEALTDTNDSTKILFRIPDLRLNAPGAYRRLIAFPRNLGYRFVPPFKRGARPESYADRITSDHLDKRIENTKEEKSCHGDILSQISASSVTCPLSQFVTISEANRSTSHCCDRENCVSGDYNVELRFDLPPSCYATTFLQEVTRGHLH